MSVARHRYTYEDDILIFYVYRYGEDESISWQRIADRMPLPNKLGSVKMRVLNFQAADCKGGLSHYSKLTKKVYAEFGNVDKEEHRKKCLAIIRKK